MINIERSHFQGEWWGNFQLLSTLKVALHSQRVVDEPFRDDQKTDEFLEIDMGSDDILSQLECAMEKGTKLENKDEEGLGDE